MNKRISAGALIFLCMFVSSEQVFAGEAPVNIAPARVPSSIRALLGSTDTLLAYKAMDASGNDGVGAVIVLRHALTDDRLRNPCELQVLRKAGDTLVVAAASDQAVECIYNDIARRAPELALDEQLEVKPREIIWSNELTRGHSTYTFGYSGQASTWFLTRAEVTYVESAEDDKGVNVYKEVASFPADFSRIAMSDFDLRSISKALASHRESIK